MIKHISLDLWNTLIVANPAYRVARSDYLAKVYHSTPDKVSRLYKHADKFVGDNLPVADRLIKTIELMSLAHGLSADIYRERDIRKDLEKLFLKHPPVINSTIQGVLQSFKDSPITLSIASNVGNMNNVVLKKMVEAWEVPMDFYVFDDLVGESKPHEKVFHEIYRQAHKLHGGAIYGGGLQPNEIIHIGDDAVADAGAKTYGMRCSIISGTPELFDVLAGIYFGKPFSELGAKVHETV